MTTPTAPSDDRWLALVSQLRPLLDPLRDPVAAEDILMDAYLLGAKDSTKRAAAARCASCDHLTISHAADGSGCLQHIAAAGVGADLLCPCTHQGATS